MRNLILLVTLTQAEMDRKEINEWKLDEEYRKGDDIEPEELPEFERPKKPIDITQLDLSDPLSVAAQSKAGQTVMVFVDISGEPTEAERDQISLLWETNMINAFNIEGQRFPIASNRVIFKLSNGSQVKQLGQMLRREIRCYSFQVEQELYLCPGHPQWNKNEPNYSKQKLERENRWKGDDWRPDGWVERIEHTIPTTPAPKPTAKSTFKFKKQKFQKNTEL